MKYFIIIISFLFVGLTSIAQEKATEKSADSKVVETSFWVDGVCGMCKNTIETALDVKGVRFAEWDQQTGIAKVIYRSDKLSEMELKKLVSKVGYRTKDVKENKEAYENLPFCCQYKERKKH
ncbi:MAG: heavy-metal-associated domain-containing protein [Bacteroidota bacterium]